MSARPIDPPRAEGAAEDLRRDLKNVLADTQSLLDTIGDQGGATLAAANARMRDALDESLERLATLQDRVAHGAKAAASSADGFVHRNPWGAIGIAAALGLAVGVLAARR